MFTKRWSHADPCLFEQDSLESKPERPEWRSAFTEHRALLHAPTPLCLERRREKFKIAKKWKQIFTKCKTNWLVTPKWASGTARYMLASCKTHIDDVRRQTFGDGGSKFTLTHLMKSDFRYVFVCRCIFPFAFCFILCIFITYNSRRHEWGKKITGGAVWQANNIHT